VNRVAALVVVLSGCRDTGWRGDRATEVVVGPYTVPIPAGWRNLAEARDQSLGFRGLADGYVVLVPERFVDAGKGSMIAMNWLMEARRPGQAIDCAGLARVPSSSGNTGGVADGHSIQIEGDDGCLITRNDGKLAIVGALRFHGDFQFLVLCSRDVAGDADADAACKTVFAGLHIPPQARR
jgi:hypothetical protein